MAGINQGSGLVNATPQKQLYHVRCCAQEICIAHAAWWLVAIKQITQDKANYIFSCTVSAKIPSNPAKYLPWFPVNITSQDHSHSYGIRQGKSVFFQKVDPGDVA